MQLIELRLIQAAWGIEHHIATAVVFGESNTVADTVKLGKQAHEAIKTVCQTTMRRSTILEGIHQEAKLELSLFGSKAKNLENLLM